ncbi:MAG: hypothetical protein AB3X44_16285 [Leptothrix sp. (in: b-proteobacteria)]
MKRYRVLVPFVDSFGAVIPEGSELELPEDLATLHGSRLAALDVAGDTAPDEPAAAQ